jgi:uncharacterized protein involved in type VI secretion and phage assembly
MSDRKYYGKTRGIVTSANDPNGRGRLRVQVSLGGPAVEVWADACVPYAGDKNGMFAIPPAGAGVWVEFEQGDPDKPIWTGCWWKENEISGAFSGIAPAALPVVLQSTGQHRLVLAGGAGGDPVVIETARGEQGPRIVMTDSSMKISCGPTMSIEITQTEVKVNSDALVVR